MKKLMFVMLLSVPGCPGSNMVDCYSMCLPNPVLRFENGACYCQQPVSKGDSTVEASAGVKK
jgi:hypothetical protein